MAEAVVNYIIFFVILFAILGIVSLINRSKLLSSMFQSFGKLLLILLQLCMLLVFTVVISLLVGLIIFIHPFLMETPQFFADGEAIHLLAPQDTALLQFAFTYGVLYIVLYFVSLRFLARTRLTRFFINIARGIRRVVPYRRSHKNLENRLIGTACQLLASSVLLLAYPVAISLLFDNVDMKMGGSVLIFVCLFIFSMIPLPGYADSRGTRSYPRTRSIRNR